jgi:hypothetical protein
MFSTPGNTEIADVATGLYAAIGSGRTEVAGQTGAGVGIRGKGETFGGGCAGADGARPCRNGYGTGAGNVGGERIGGALEDQIGGEKARACG